MGETKKARQSAVDETAEGSGDKLSTKEHERALARLHVELVRLQQWVVYKGLKICIAFEGRDGAGKAGVIVTFDRAGKPCRRRAVPTGAARGRVRWKASRHFRQSNGADAPAPAVGVTTTKSPGSTPKRAFPVPPISARDA